MQSKLPQLQTCYYKWAVFKAVCILCHNFFHCGRRLQLAVDSASLLCFCTESSLELVGWEGLFFFAQFFIFGEEDAIWSPSSPITARSLGRKRCRQPSQQRKPNAGKTCDKNMSGTYYIVVTPWLKHYALEREV